MSLKRILDLMNGASGSQDSLFTRTLAVTPGIKDTWQPLQTPRLTEGSLRRVIVDFNILKQARPFLQSENSLPADSLCRFVV